MDEVEVEVVDADLGQGRLERLGDRQLLVTKPGARPLARDPEVRPRQAGLLDALPDLLLVAVDLRSVDVVEPDVDSLLDLVDNLSRRGKWSARDLICRRRRGAEEQEREGHERGEMEGRKSGWGVPPCEPIPSRKLGVRHQDGLTDVPFPSFQDPKAISGMCRPSLSLIVE